MGTVMRSPHGEQATVPAAGVASMRALGWTEQQGASRRSSASDEDVEGQAPKRRPGRPRKSDTTEDSSGEGGN